MPANETRLARRLHAAIFDYMTRFHSKRLVSIVTAIGVLGLLGMGSARAQDPDIIFTQDDSTVSIATSDSIASIYMRFSGTISPTLIQTQMIMGGGMFDDTTTVLIYSLSDQYMTEGPLISYTGAGTLDSVDVADIHGQPLLAMIDIITDITPQEPSTLPSHVHLAQNYPNPFNPCTEIAFSLDRAGSVDLTIYDMLGRTVRALVQRRLAAGRYSATWEGIDKSGTAVASGVYFYRLTADEESISRKMLLIR